MGFPAAIPEVPVSDVARAIAHYSDVLGFTLDWHDEESGIAGISRGNCRLFLTSASFRNGLSNASPSLFWLNLDSRSQVDDLFKAWENAGARIIQEPRDKPWKLREFIAADADGNLMRVFYDFGTPERESAR